MPQLTQPSQLSQPPPPLHCRYKIGPEKGAILDALVRLVEPELVVELGSFVGYSAVRDRGVGAARRGGEREVGGWGAQQWTELGSSSVR